MARTFLRLDDDTKAIRGVGEVKSKLLERLGIKTVENLIYYLPRRYEDRRQIVKISDLIPGGAPQAFCASVVSVEQRIARKNKNMHITRACLSDGSSVIWALWFNHYSLPKILHTGTELALYGSLQPGRTSHEIISPEFEILNGSEPHIIGCIVPIYPTTAGLNEKWLRRIIMKTLDVVAPIIPEYLPEHIIRERGLISAADALRQVHQPTGERAYLSARKRLVYEEFFLLQTGLALRRRSNVTGKLAVPLNGKPTLTDKFIQNLPYTLTDDQKRAIAEITGDITKTVPMNRLLQGDVGSGKTVVAITAMLRAIDSGMQAALMAPTAVLAQQLANVLRKWLSPLGIEVSLLTGGLPAAEKKKIQGMISTGEIQLVVGTHALIQESVNFPRLGIIVIDEQHRFGVLQRKALISKNTETVPHALTMTATPIPRTLALSIYGDLTISTIRHLPKGRQPIRSVWIGDNRLPGMLKFLETEMASGRQVYWVCPLIEESENFDAAPLEQRYEKLKAVFPKRKVAMLHGRMSEKDKNSIMSDFASGAIDLLASTTVIEVGIDNSNATVIVIENAERFGMSQLHQLRGRVGRGKYKSWCVLYANPKAPEAIQRLDRFCKLTDGFAIAEADMKMRGPGEFCGTRQHGLTDFRIADLTRDGLEMEQARSDAFELVSNSGEDIPPQLIKAVRQRYGQLLEIAQTA